MYVCSAKSLVGSIIIALVNFIAFVFLSSFLGSFSIYREKIIITIILLTAVINICDEFASSNEINDLSVGGYWNGKEPKFADNEPPLIHTVGYNTFYYIYIYIIKKIKIKYF